MSARKDELALIATLLATLDKIGPTVRRRVLDYITSVYDEEDDPFSAAAFHEWLAAKTETRQ